MKTKLITFIVTLVCSATLFASNVITYTATEKLPETTDPNRSGFHTNAFDVPISSHTFSNGIGTISFAYEVTSIGNYAFQDCKGLTSITIPNSVSLIGSFAFYGCSSLTSITIPNSVTSIGDYAFLDCAGLTSITIPNSVTSIGDCAFYRCSGLTKPIYNANCFAYMLPSYKGAYTIPEGIKQIAGYAFYGCSGLTSVTIPNSVTSIGDRTFYDCSGLTSITIPNSVTSIGHSAFEGCSGLTKPIYNANCFAYMPHSYKGAYTIPNGIKQISGGAFYGCSSLTSITIPNSVTTIGNKAFLGCSGLTKTNFTGTIAEWCKIKFEDISSNPMYNNLNFYINDVLIKDLVIPNGVDTIGKYAFYNCTGLTSITIPNSVTSIGAGAFFGCSGLTSVTIGNSVNLIGIGAFRDCVSLTSVTFSAPNPPTWDGWGDEYLYPFSGCNNLHNIYVDCRADLNAYKQAFRTYDYNIEYLNKHYSITRNTIDGGKIESNNEYACDDEEVILTAIPDFGYRFVKWSDGLTSNSRAIIMIRDYFFTAEFEQLDTIVGKCGDNLTYTFIPKDGTLTITGSGAMYDKGYDSWSRWADQIKTINLPQRLTHIGSWAFADCVNVRSIVIPAFVVSIGCGAFYNDYNINDITCYAQIPPTIDCDDTFYKVSRYAYLYVQSDIIRQYQINQYWQNFDIQSIGASSNNKADNDVIVIPGISDATFTWPVNNQANGYSLEITKDGVVFCTLKFNSNGQLTGIAFAPSRNDRHNVPTAIMSANGWQFTVTGLETASRYNYTLDVTDAAQSKIKTYSGTFATDGYTALENISKNESSITKFLRDGQLYIQRNGIIYDARGARIE